MAQCQQHNTTLPIRLPHTATNSSTCPLLNTSAQRELVGQTLQSYHPDGGPPCSCGGAGGWTRAAYLNMSDPNQQCPSNWTLVTTPIRGCGRRARRSYRECDSVTYSVHGRTYSSVCGRILAYQRGVAYAFYNALIYNLGTIDTAYLSGVSLTHGPAGSRQHIWSFVGARYEQDPDYYTDWNCPCTNTNISWPYQVPSVINNNYFCDTGNPGPGTSSTTYYTDDPLWDGKGCSSTSTCCEFNTPPWFCKSLSQPTSDDLEIHTFSSGSEDRLISLIDVYIK